MNELPKGLVVSTLDVVIMPNGEILCLGKTIGWFEDLKEYLNIKKDK